MTLLIFLGAIILVLLLAAPTYAQAQPTTATPSFIGKDFGDLRDVTAGLVNFPTGVLHDERGVFIPWSVICEKGSQYLVKPCSELINSDGSLTQAGDTAVGCIRNGLAAAIAATKVNLPFDLIKKILSGAAGLTGCGGIVNMDQIQNSNQLQYVLHAAGGPAGAMAQQNSTIITSTNNSSTNFLTYSNPTYGINIQYPSSWLTEESHNQSSNDIVKFSSPAGSAPASLNIIGGKPVPQSIPLQLYINASLYVLRQSFDNFNLIESNSTTLGGFPAAKIVYTGIIPSSGLELKFMQILTIKDGKDFVITFGTLPTDFSTYLPTIQKMIDSFSFIPVSTPAIAPSINATSTPTPPLIAKPNQNTSSVPAVPVQSSNKTYTNATDGLTIGVPQGWSTEEGQNKANDTLLTVVALSPPISLDPNALMQLVVQKDTRPSTSSSIDQYLRDELTSYRSNPSNNFKLVSANTGFTVSEQPAYQLVFTYTATTTGPSKQLEVGMLLKGQAYIIDYYGAAGLFPKFLPQAQQIIKSLVVQPP